MNSILVESLRAAIDGLYTVIDRPTIDRAALHAAADRLLVLIDALPDVRESAVAWADAGMTPMEGLVCEIIFNDPGRIVSRERIYAALYSNYCDDPPHDKIVDIYLCKVRRKLPPGYKIQTVRGLGWRGIIEAEDRREAA